MEYPRMEGEDEVLQKIVDLLISAGYVRANIATLSPFDKLTGGLSWCIAACSIDADFDLFYDDDATLGYKIKVGESIEKALQKMECPYPLQAHQIQGLDYPAVYPVVEWLVKLVSSTREAHGDQLWKFMYWRSQKYQNIVKNKIADFDMPDQPDPNLVAKYISTKDSQRKMDYVLKQISEIEENNRVLQDQVEDATRKLSRLKEIIEEQEKERCDLELQIDEMHDSTDKVGSSALLEKLPLMEKCKVGQDNGCTTTGHGYEITVKDTLHEESLKLNAIRRDLAKTCQNILSSQRKLDELPCQAELMQYERCFVELYLHIQAKLQETRNYYATYNALTEANELMEKEISLLNSINSQLEEGMASQAGRSKFLSSMTDIARGVQQKLGKMEARFHGEQKPLFALKERHQQLVAERRHYVTMLKQFQEECAKNDALKSTACRIYP